MIQSISQGIPGTAMTPWRSQLSTLEIEQVTDLIRDKFMLAVTANDASPGRKIYAEYCSVCHGDAGQGAMWAMQGLSPPPANFTDPKVIQSLDRNGMILAVTFGRVETAMTGWSGRLNPSDVEVVVDYIMAGFMGIDDAGTGTGIDAVAMSAPQPFNLTGDVNAGMGLYSANCATCHGDVGDGRGPRAYFINPKPRNFTHTASRAVLNRPALFHAVSKGRLYSEMPAWNKVLSKQQIADVAEYVFQQFIQPTKR
jgi:mono/diheme cytochrome c family protein